ncbi:cytochrome P450 [Actinosynnema sp. NPDC020468]|uniref:cytochrome P450 family protein n=1 Tax=Actinosynnema sp. NPDC020468 TaxID=3154488 RepID=UPI0033E5C3D7
MTVEGVRDLTTLNPDAEFQRNLHDVLADWRDNGPVRWVLLPDGRRCGVVTRYADAVAVLSDPTMSSDLPRGAREFGPPLDPEVLRTFDVIHEGLLFTTDPPDHTRLRKCIVREFTARRVELLRPRVRQLADELLRPLADRSGPVDLIGAYTYPLAVTVLCELLGIPEGDRSDFRSWIDTAIGFVGDPRDIPRVVVAMDSLNGYFSDLLAAKRRDRAQDLLGALARSSEQGELLTDRELLHLTRMLYIAGHETSVQAVNLALLALFDNPDRRHALAADPELASTAVDEFLRYDGPVVPGLFRYATADVEVGGEPVPRGSLLVVSLSAANRDPSRFPAPDALCPAREDNPHLGFGWGIHYCVGARLAKATAEITIGSLLRTYPEIELAIPAAELRWRPGFMRAIEELPVLLPGPAGGER